MDQTSSFQPLKDEYQRSRVISVITVCLVILTLLGAFWAGMFPLRDRHDAWSHLKTGEVLWAHFSEHGFHFPTHDMFTYTGSETSWVNHEWLSDLIFYTVFRMGGLLAAVTFKALIFTLTIGLLILYMFRNGVGWKMSCVGSMITLLACQNTLGLVPPIFTYLFVVIFLHIILSLQQDEHFRLAVLGAVLFEIVWANLHSGAVIGIVLMFFWWLSELWFCLITWMRENPRSPWFRRLGTCTWIVLAVAFASLITPFTYHIYLESFNVSGDWWLLRNLEELKAPNMHYANAFEAIILGLLLLPMMRAGSIWIFEGLAIVFFGHQALNHIQYIPLFALVATPPLVSALAEERRAIIPADRDRSDYSGFWGNLLARVKWGFNFHVDVILVFALFAYTFGMRPGKIWHHNALDFPTLVSEGYVRDAFPCQAVDFIEQAQLSGPMFNDYQFAGYLIYRLSPENMKVYTDNRFDLWGSRYAKETKAVYSASEFPLGAYHQRGTWREFNSQRSRDDFASFVQKDQYPELTAWYANGQSYWQFVLDKHGINFIVSVKDTPLDRLLREQFQGWFLVFDRGGYVIHLRGKPENAASIREHTINHRDRLTESN